MHSHLLLQVMASYTWEYFALDAFGRKVGTAAVVATAAATDVGAPQVMYDANGQPVVPGAGAGAADKDPEIGAGGLAAAGEVTPLDGEGGSHESPHDDHHGHHKHHDDPHHHQGHHEHHEHHHHDHHRQHGEGNATDSHAPSHPASHPQPSAPAAPVTHHNEGDLELTSPVVSDRIVGDP
jgi:hypothetical protein